MNSAAQVTMPRLYRRGSYTYALLWLLVFVTYFPTMHAGFVADTTGWLSNIHSLSFRDYLNDSMSTTKSMYQLTQLVTWLFYQLFGTHIPLWRLLFISLHTLNAWMAYRLLRRLLTDSGMAAIVGARCAVAGSILFCISPHLTEAMVWNASYHYLQGMALMLSILLLAQQYIHCPHRGYALLAALLFFLSTFAIELFYLTPFMLLAMLLYYSGATNLNKANTRRALLYFFLPTLFLFGIRLLLYRIFYGHWTPHVQQLEWTNGDAAAYFSKPLKYLFHLVFMGRFFSHAVRARVYDWCALPAALVTSYTLLVGTACYMALRLRRFSAAIKVAALCYIWVCIGMVIILPLWFYDLFLVTFDRYLYHLCAFFYFIPVLLISRISYRGLRIALIAAIAAYELYFTAKLVRFWHQSTQAVKSLQQNFPPPNGRTLLLLDLPYCLQGIPMIPSFDSSEFKLMHNELFPPAFSEKAYDVLSFNMVSRNDGAHVQVKNDSTVSVILNQWGTWWWHNNLGAIDYETADYRIKIEGGGLYYNLTLKYPHTGYLLLYQTAGHWKEVDWTRKGNQF